MNIRYEIIYKNLLKGIRKKLMGRLGLKA